MKRLALFLPVERRVLSTAGTLQSTLGELFDEPIDVKVRRQTQSEDKIHRAVDLRGRISGRVACCAVSDLAVVDPEIRTHVLSGRLGLGQILAVVGKRSTFQFEDVGRENATFWRRYRLSGEGFSFSIRETFPDSPYRLNRDAAGGGYQQAGGAGAARAPGEAGVQRRRRPAGESVIPFGWAL